MPAATYYERNKDRWKVYRQNRLDRDRPQCAAEDLCDDLEYAKGFCFKHYKRWYRHGVLFSPKALAGLKTDSQRRREYYLANREKRLAYEKARRWADPEAARAYERAVRSRRKEKHRATSNARTRKMGYLNVESLDYQAVLRNDPCSYCGGRAEQVDHIVPVAADGENHWTNLTAACQPCNRAKWDKPLLVALSAYKKTPPTRDGVV